MWPDRVSNPGPLIYESGALPTALRGPAQEIQVLLICSIFLLIQYLTSFYQNVLDVNI